MAELTILSRPSSNTQTHLPFPQRTIALRWVTSYSTTSIPPQEWIEPFTDISDVVSLSGKKLEPSIWVSRIVELLDESPNMEVNLTDYCRKYLIKLTPNFIAYCIELTQFYCLLGFSTSFGMTVNSSNSMIKEFGNLGMDEELLWVWRRMKDTGIEPSLYTYNFLMNGLVNSMFIDSAEQVFEVMENGKMRPDIITYNTSIKGYCKAGKMGKAMEKFKEMERRNLEPDKNTYHEIPPHANSLVIGGLCKDGKYAEGCAVLDDMCRRGCKANVAIYTALIDTRVKSGNVEEAINLFLKMKNGGDARRMKDTGIEPSLDTGIAQKRENRGDILFGVL